MGIATLLFSGTAVSLRSCQTPRAPQWLLRAARDALIRPARPCRRRHIPMRFAVTLREGPDAFRKVPPWRGSRTIPRGDPLSFTLPRIAGTAVLAITAAALGLPSASVADAQVLSPVTFYLGDQDSDGQAGLFFRTASSSGHWVSESADTDVTDLTVSADGSHLAYVFDDYAHSTEQVVVRDAQTGTSVVVASHVLDVNAPVLDFEVALSPDATKVVWTRWTAGAVQPVTMLKAAVGSGTSSTLSSDLAFGAFVSATDVLAQDAGGAAAVLPWAGGTAVPAPTVPVGAYDLALSPDGTRLAYVVDTSDTSSSLSVAPLSTVDGVPTLGTAVDLATSDWNDSPSFTDSGAKVLFTHQVDGYEGRAWTAPTDGSAPAAVDSSISIDVLDTATALWDTTPPAAPTPLPVGLSGTSVLLGWQPLEDDDAAGVTVWHSATSPTSGISVAAPVSSLRYYGPSGTGLKLGQTYTVGLQAYDKAGNRSAIVPFSFTALAPAPTFADPTSTTSAKQSFPVTFAATAPAAARFDVDYLVAGTTTWKHWVTNATGRARFFGVASSTTGVASTTSTPGSSYVFRARATDAYGNSTAWVLSGHAVVPFDQSKATLSGGSTISSSSSYLGAYRQLRTTASYAKVTLTGNRLQVIGLKCTSCGKFAIYQGSTKLATVDTYASSTKVRQVLYTKTWTTVASRTFTIRPLATAGRPNVDLDGFATRR